MDDPQRPDLTLTDVIFKILQDNPRTTAAVGAALALFILAGFVVLWLLWGTGPRRRRALRSASKLLQAGNTQGALDQLKRVRAIGAPSSAWIKRFDQFEAACLQASMQAALDAKKFEDALQIGQRVAQILDQPEHEVRMNVQAAMVREIRRLFSKHGETTAAKDLIARTFAVQTPCREASFWQALCDIRSGAMESALTNLQIARTGSAKSAAVDDSSPKDAPSAFLDPPLYLGAIHLRTGRAKDALRFLTEANRMDANCPFVTLQLGAAIVAAGGDTNMAVRALQRALGPKGLGLWQDEPQRAWVEGFPEHRSYVRKLASEFPFTCPLFGEDMKYLIRQGNLALAQGHFKLNNFQEAAELFDKVLKEGAPSLPVLRGLGLSLAKLGRFDDAFIHLRTAQEMEEVKDRLTTGYLALCGACGKPARPEDKLENTAWALRLVTQFNVPGDPEWIGILNRIFAEARQADIPLSNDDQLYLCEHLVSVKACDPLSAQAYHFLMATAPSLMHPEYAWLYCRADQQHDVGGAQAIALYTMTFAHVDAARAFYAAQSWDFDAIERMFLRRTAEQAPGQFPAILGADYRPRGEQLLLAKAQALEEAGDREEGLRTIEILVKLSPNNTSAMDRAAGLHYRAGRLEPAYALLEQWHQSQPEEPLPLVRQALLLHQQGNSAACFDKLRQAMSLSAGRRRANIAFLGARLALERYMLPVADQPADDMLASVQDFLQDCLANEPAHPHALWCQAAVRWLHGDVPALAAQAGAMTDPDVADPRYHYLAALCHLLGGQFEAVPPACDLVSQKLGSNGTAAQRSLAVEAGYLAALAQIGLDRPLEAVNALRPVAANAKSPTLPFAQALLGNMLFRAERHDEAIAAWQALDPARRLAWNLVEPLAQTTFLSALESMQRAEYEQAAAKLREAGKLGLRDRRLGPLLFLCLFKAGQQAIYAGETAPVTASDVTQVAVSRAP
jgi:tetratricopeptide (TPR) repeat protein